MARGFPASNTISPGVRINEIDLSFLPAVQSFHRAGIVGFASKGPINIPTFIGSKRQLNTIFGNPHPDVGDPYLIYAGEQYLSLANELFVVRVGDEEKVSDEAATTAEVDIPSSGGQIVIVSATSGPYDFTVDVTVSAYFFKWKLNGILASKTLVVVPAILTAEELADELNDQLSPTIDGIEFFDSSGDIAIRTTFAFGPESSLEFISVQDAIYGASGISGLGSAMTAAVTIGDNDRFPTDAYQLAGEWDLDALDGTPGATVLNIVIDGSDNVLIDNVVQTIDLADMIALSLAGGDLTSAEVVIELNAQIALLPGGFVAGASGDNITLTTLHEGRDARILVKSNSSAIDVFGFDGLTAVGVSPSGVTTDGAVSTFGIIVGSDNTTGEVTFVITAESPGIDGNSTQVTILNDIRDGVFSIQVFNNSNQVEAWGNLTKNQFSSFYVETFLALVSDWIRAEDNTDTASPPADGTFDLSGGNDGIPADPDDQDDLIIGNAAIATGMFALGEPEQIDIDIIAVPGHSSTVVILALIELCEEFRQDCMALIDPPFGLSVEEIVQWQNGTHPLNTIRFDSDFAALYWPWLKLRDTFNNIDVFVPPSGSVMAVYARNDQLAAPWFAPAGLTRGIVPGILDVFTRPTLEERDTMYGNRNAVNPIVQFADNEDFVVWGQKTLQRRPSALDRVNVRRLLFVVEKRISDAARSLLFDPHDEIFREKFVSLAAGILEEIQVGRGISGFIIQADTELNTSDVIDRNEFRARIGVQPVRAAEFIFLEFSIHRTGSFTESADVTF